MNDDDDIRTGGPAKVGDKFMEYCTQHQLKPEKNVPKVDVKFKIYRVSDFDQKRGTIYVEFIMMLDWNDPSLEIADDQKKPDFRQHFWPAIEILNLTSDSPDPPDSNSAPPRLKFDNSNEFGKWRCTITTKYKCTIYSRNNYSDFPFDYQTLEISCKLANIHIPGTSKGSRPEVCNPGRWRRKEGGHVLIRDADCLPEFSLVRLVGRPYSSAFGPFPETLKGRDNKAYTKYQKECSANNGQPSYIDQYTLQIIVARNSASVMWNMCFSLFVIDCLVFSAHGIPIGSLEDRLGVNLTLLLTAMAFKWVLSEKLPDVPYLTTMEKYTLMTFMMLFFQGMFFWVMADLYAYRCAFSDDLVQSASTQNGNSVNVTEEYTDWFTGEIRSNSNGASKVFDVTCRDIHIGDRILLGIEAALMVGKNIWFLVRVFGNKLKTLKKQTEFYDLGGLDEYSTEEELKWVPPPENDTNVGSVNVKVSPEEKSVGSSD
jgi:hypothetical protein